MSCHKLVLLVAALLGLAHVASAQPTLVVERPQRTRYISDAVALRGEVFSFALPGRRYLHCGTTDVPGPPRIHREVMFAITKANGDTVRYVRLNRTPLGGAYDYVKGAVLNPDHTLTVWFEHIVSSTTPTSRDSLSLICLDTLGRLRWQRSQPYVPFVYPGRLVRTGDGYLVTASPLAFPPGSGNASPKPGLWKFDLQGQVVWQRDWRSRGYGGVGAIEDIIPHPDGSYLALGMSDDGTPYAPGQPTRGRLDYYLVKLRHNGDTLWTRHFGVLGDDEYGSRLRLCPDGTVALLGDRYTSTTRRSGQALLVDTLGRIKWTSTITNPRFDLPYYLLQPLVNGNVVFGGYDMVPIPNSTLFTAPGLLECRMPAGTQAWRLSHFYPNATATRWYSLVSNPDGSAYLAGDVYGLNGAVPVGQNAYFATFANVGVPYAPDLCRTPPTAAFAPAFNVAGDSVLVFDQSTAGPRYGELVAWHWDFGDGSTYDGPVPPWHRYASAPGAGLRLRLTVTNNLGCQHTYSVLPLASRAQQLQARLALYPNPATETVTVELSGLRSSGPVAVEVCNTLGQVVRRITVTPRQGRLTQPLNLRDLPAGVYLVRLRTVEGTLVKRLVKQ